MESPHYVLEGQYEITTVAFEPRMSLWVYSPVIVERATGRVVLDLSSGLWDLRRVNERPGRILLTLARFPEGDREYVVEVAPVEAIAVVDGVTHPLLKLEAALNAIA
ncbi:hypothetical protein HW452_12650 [Halomonas aquamarina]|uniref:Uncharacterized protein n=1 Tax=Vreelandella aquamarina TaxID=77097 RepID=A0ACC5VVQ5_9GAMM|nr:hypothetical protein [Halomonas aquamarina]MBZ5488373.1 hypothetical protein [Halomonas aquamarina]